MSGCSRQSTAQGEQMQVSVASEPIRLDSPNLDWVGATDRVAIVLDGLTEGAETGCVHGTAWYVHELGSRLLAHAGSLAEKTLAASLSGAITEVAALHAATCDLTHPGSPCSTVTMIRQRGQLTDYLVLADSPLVLDTGHTPTVIIDESEKVFSAQLESTARGGSADDLANLINDQQQYRNTAAGYWVAQVDPAAAGYALTGTVDSARGALLASDGAALLVTDFHEHTWDELLQLGYQHGPQAIITATRKAEGSDPERTRWPRYKVSDDATAAVCRIV
jgi:hypothetical protein